LFNTWLFNQKLYNGSSAEIQPPVIIGGGDLGNKFAPFFITYKVFDPQNQKITVIEKLNDTVINTRVNVPQNVELVFEINEELWKLLAINSYNTITIEAINESELSSVETYTFKRANNIPSTPAVISPVEGTSVVGTVTIEWTESIDPDGQDVTYKVYYSTNGGITKTLIVAGITDLSILWDVSELAPRDDYQIFVCANDGIDDSAFGSSGVFKITSKRLSIPDHIEIKDSDDNLIALLSPESDGLKDCWIDRELNGVHKLEFNLPITSPKWEYINPKNKIHVKAQGRTYEFTLVNPDATEQSREEQKITGKVIAYEAWTLLSKEYVTVTNDPQRPNPPWSVVAILSGGSDLSGGRYPVGSAGHALYALLQGTGWTIDTVDVEGIYDLETEKESLLANINKVQELWGGFLVWDSINKTISLRDETKWQNYTGFQVRYDKNLKSITRIDDYDIVTRLYPFGENDLNIANVNDGLLYIENFSYTDKVYEGIWYDQNIRDQQALKEAAERHLAKVCRPRHKYTIKSLDLRVLDEYKHEIFQLGDMIDVIDKDLGIQEYQRIIRHRFNVFQPWLCELDVGDPIEKISASLADSIKMSDYIKSTVKPNPSFHNILKAVINTAATIINGANGDYTLVDGVSTWFDRDENGNLTGNLVRITPKGLIISSDGGQTWDLAINGEGVNANTITTGILNAALVNIISAGGNVVIDDTGMKVYDSSDDLRVLAGSWVEDAIRKYGIRIIDGEIYSTLISTKKPGATGAYAEISPTGTITIYDILGRIGLMLSGLSGQGTVDWYFGGTKYAGAFINAGTDRDLIIWTQQSNSGINLSTYNGAAVEIGRGGGNSINLEASVVFASADLDVREMLSAGSIVSFGSKNCAEPTENYGIRLLNAVEAPELKYYDSGVIYLQNGEATVHLDPIFLECIEPDTELTPWQIWVQCYGENDVYVSEVGKDYFKVKERNGGIGNNKVVWRFEATRKNYAGIRLMEVVD